MSSPIDARITFALTCVVFVVLVINLMLPQSKLKWVGVSLSALAFSTFVVLVVLETMRRQTAIFQSALIARATNFGLRGR